MVAGEDVTADGMVYIHLRTQRREDHFDSSRRPLCTVGPMRYMAQRR